MPEWATYLIAAAVGTLLAIAGPPLARWALSMGGAGSRQIDQQRQEASLLALNSMYGFLKTQVGEWGPTQERIRDERSARMEDVTKAIRIDVMAMAQNFSDLLGVSLKVRDQQAESLVELQKLVALMAEFTDTNRRVMREFTGSAGTEEDIILERAVQIRAQYPDLKLEDCIKRARAMMAYGSGRSG